MLRQTADPQHGIDVMPTPGSAPGAPAVNDATASDERLRLLLETIPVGVLSCERDGRLDFFNTRAAELWGRRPALHDDRERFCGSLRIFSVTGELIPHAGGPMGRALRTGAPQLNQECVIERADGSRVPLLVNVVPHLNAQGHVVGAVSCMVDITERKQAEALLTARENQFRSILENAPVIIVRYNREFRRTFVNRALCTTLGVPEEALVGGLVGMWPQTDKHAPFQQVEVARAALERAFETGEHGRFILAIGSDKEERTLDVSLEPERDMKGNVVSALAIAHDITALKSTENALQRAKAYLLEGQRLTHTGSWAWDARTRRNVFWSKETYHIFGLEPPQDWTGGILAPASYQETLNRLHPEDRESFEVPLLRAIRERIDYERDYRVVRPDGTVRFIHSCGHPVFDDSGQVTEVIGTVMDITEQKLSNALLAAEKQTLEMIARGAALPAVLDHLCAAMDEQSPGVISTILLVDADGQKLWPTAGPHCPPQWVEFITPLSIGPDVGSCGTAVHERKTIIVSDIAADRRWAPYKDVAVAQGLRACWSTPIFSVTGQVLGTFAMYYHEPRSPQPRDFMLIDRATRVAQIAIERVRAQESLREAQMNLARVSRVTTVGELTAAIAHEVNQPLAAVETNASACVRWLSATPPNIIEAHKAASHIAHDAKRAGEIIVRIRALLRKDAPVKSSVDLNEIIREVLVFTQPEVSRQKITLQTTLAPHLPLLTGDRVQLQQVVLNLLMNAIEALSAVADRPRVIAIQTDQPDPGLVRVAIRDTGVGLTPAQMTHLFEALHTTKPLGLGMGLSISRSIIEAHGGRVWATPNAGPGVTFQFSLPIERAEAT